MNISEDFSKRLQSLMTERGISMADLARMLHTQQSTINRWNRGSKPQRATMIQLAQALRVELDWLARGTGPRPLSPNGPSRGAEKSSQIGEYVGQTPPDSRSGAMAYGIIKQDDGATEDDLTETVLGAVLNAMTMDDLLGMAARLREAPAAMAAVLDEARRRARDIPPNVSPPPRT